MAHFRGVVQGNRGDASRLGSKDSGISVEAQGWEGKVIVGLYHDERAGHDMARICLAPHVNGAGTDKPIYDGPVGRLELAGLYPTYWLFKEIGVVLQGLMDGDNEALVAARLMLTRLQTLGLVGDENGNDHE